MSAKTPRYIIENHGPDNEAIKTAFASAFQVCAQNGISEITLLVPVKGAFPNTVVGTFLGTSNAKALCKGQSLTITSGLRMNLESTKTFSPYRSYGMVIGIYLSRNNQAVLDSISSARAIVLLPWSEDEGKLWLSTWGATVLGKSTWVAPMASFPPDVETALLDLTRDINLSTGLSHPSDKDSAKQTLSDLKKLGHRLQPEDIRKWALRNNWQPRDAEALGKLAVRIFGHGNVDA